jgi:uncharacterized protein (TIGR01244 family)
MKNRDRIVILITLGISLLVYFESDQIFSERTRLTSFIANVLFKDNFHQIIPTKLYRSAEMPSERLEQRIKENGIKTVIDLRLSKDDEESALTDLSEEETVNSLGAKYIHFPLRGTRELSREELLGLLEIFKEVKPPLLVHCSSGTHRSGVVSAMWMIDQEQMSVSDAAQQLSPRYGFFGFERGLKSLIQGHATVDNLLWTFQEKQKAHNMTLREWAEGRQG